MTFRKRKLIAESFELNQDEYQDGLEAEVIESDVSNAEMEAHLVEGTILAEDTDTTEAIYNQLEATEEVSEGTLDTVILATETIANRWGIRKERSLATESMSVYSGGSSNNQSSSNSSSEKKEGVLKGIGKMIAELWKRFLEWVGGIIDSIAAGLKNFTNLGKKFESRGKKYTEMLKTAKEPAERKSVKVFGRDVRLLTVDNNPTEAGFWNTDFGNAVSLMAESIASWTTDRVVDSKNLIKLTVEGNGKVHRSKDTLRSAKATEKFTPRNSFFKATNRKLSKIGPSDDKEEQVIYPLPNNDYVQAFVYEGEVRVKAEESKGNVSRDGDTPNTVPYKIAGIRYISAFGENAAVKDGDVHGFVYDNLTKPQLEALAITLTKLGKTLADHEKKYSEMVKQCKALREQAKQANRDAENKELSAYDRACATVANRVAREAMKTVSESYRASSQIMRNAGKGAIVWLHTSLKAYK